MPRRRNPDGNDGKSTQPTESTRRRRSKSKLSEYVVATAKVEYKLVLKKLSQQNTAYQFVHFVSPGESSTAPYPSEGSTVPGVSHSEWAKAQIPYDKDQRLEQKWKEGLEERYKESEATNRRLTAERDELVQQEYVYKAQEVALKRQYAEHRQRLGLSPTTQEDDSSTQGADSTTVYNPVTDVAIVRSEQSR
nr:hypothetical protein L203_05214 [Cryptococcus depauperatus CBS 7841]